MAGQNTLGAIIRKAAGVSGAEAERETLRTSLAYARLAGRNVEFADLSKLGELFVGRGRKGWTPLLEEEIGKVPLDKLFVKTQQGLRKAIEVHAERVPVPKSAQESQKALIDGWEKQIADVSWHQHGVPGAIGRHPVPAVAAGGTLGWVLGSQVGGFSNDPPDEKLKDLPPETLVAEALTESAAAPPGQQDPVLAAAAAVANGSVPPSVAALADPTLSAAPAAPAADPVLSAAPAPGSDPSHPA